MKPFQKKVKKKIPEILEDIVTKGDLSLTKEVLDKQKGGADKYLDLI